MDYNKAINYLNSFTKSGKPVRDLSRFKGLMKELDNPQNSVKYIHIAGTNGKGSVSEYTALALQCGGFITGKFTSPYINRVEERIQLDGEPISKGDFAFYISEVKNAAERTACPDYSQFEILNAAAFLYYAEKNCDYGVLEAGIGGLLDCSNIVTPLLSVITTIDLDHCAVLGNTVGEIAVHKAGIIKENIPSVTAPFQQQEALQVLKSKAKEVNSHLIIPDDSKIKLIKSDLFGTDFSYKGKIFHTKMRGKHQMINAVTAIEALRALNISENAIEKALNNAAVPARMEKIGDFIIDGAHNPSGASAAASFIKGIGGSKTLVTGMLATKDYKTALSLLIPCFDHVVAVDFFSDTAVKFTEIEKLAASFGKPCFYAKSADEAFEAAEKIGDNLKMVCGSLYLCGNMRGVILKGKN